MSGGAKRTATDAAVHIVKFVWAAPGHETDWVELVHLVHAAHPGRAVVGYEEGDELARARHAGFADVGPQLVWTR